MSVQTVTKSAMFKPEMIDDIVEVVAYDQADGTLQTIVGALAAYSMTPEVIGFKLAGLDDAYQIPREGYTISITHYEFVLAFASEEDDQ